MPAARVPTSPYTRAAVAVHEEQGISEWALLHPSRFLLSLGTTNSTSEENNG